MWLDSRSLRNQRSAFTLVELLAVIAIIAVLAGLAGWGVVAMIGNQQRRNTESTVRVVDKVLQDHWRYVIEEAKKDTPSVAVQALAAPDPTGARARVLWIKCRLAEAFPQSFAEITTPFVYSAGYIPTGQQRDNVAYKKRIATPTIANTQAATQSSACLLMALSINRGGIVLDDDQIRFAIADGDNDGVKEMVDAFGTPLAFIRFATGSNVQAVNPAVAGARNKNFADPVDPDGMLMSATWPASSSGRFVSSFHPILNPLVPGAANYVLPVVVSAGKDKLMALNADGSSAGAGANDNIFNFNLRLD